MAEGTAASLLSYSEFHHVSKNAERLTRVPTANTEWIVKDWDGEVYIIKFNANFSKKHLFTFSKDLEKTKQKASDLHSANPGKSDSENWHDAEMELLKNKIVKNIDKRAVANTCQCGHVFTAHLNPNPHPPPANLPGTCNTCAGGGGACAKFATPYGIAREYVGKPTHDPLAGAITTRNTCVILNWVPKADFEDIVGKSIQAVEKPHGWVKGNALAVPVAGATPPSVAAATKVLRWDFGPSRVGAVIVATHAPPALPTFANYQGCFVKAKKIGSEWGKQTWEIFHMETSHGNVPF